MKINVVILWLFLPWLLAAQPMDKTSTLTLSNQLSAYRIDEKIVMDGHLDDSAWANAEVSNQFTQLEPNPGEPSKFTTQVRVLYDNDAIYIGAVLKDTLSKIRTDLTARDKFGNADFFNVIIDTYSNGLTATQLAVTAAGVQVDGRFDNDNLDSSWDGVWQSAVSLGEDNWTLEMKIPYSALRFSEKDEHTWFINFGRYIRRNRETSFWNPIDPNVAGLVRQSGTLTNIKSIDTPLRLSLTPFVVGSYTIVDNNKSKGFSAGMDLKYGLTEAFTLDMTLIPDFSQAQSDDQVLNLGPFELFFEEQRQFFTEGIELFSRANLFYSRRVGGKLFYQDQINKARDTVNFTSTPTTARLLNASKISGRLPNGDGIGFFNAVEAKQYAEGTNQDDQAVSILANPLTNYNVLVYDKVFKHNSYVSLVNTNVTRVGTAYDANVTGTEFRFRDSAQKYQVNGNAALSQKYYSDNTSLGHKATLSLSDISGNWTSSIGYAEESEDYDPNDLGFLFSPNERNAWYEITYNQFEPKGIFNRYNVWAFTSVNGLYKPSKVSNVSLNLGGFWFTKKFFAFGLSSQIQPISRDYFEPRTADFSQYYSLPSYVAFNPFISTDYSKKAAIDVRLEYQEFLNSPRRNIALTVKPRLQINSRCLIIAETTVRGFSEDEGYVDKSQIDYGAFGLGAEQVAFGTRDRFGVINALEAVYIFNNTSSVNVRVRHYWDNVQYQRFGTLRQDGSLDTFPFDGNDAEGRSVYNRNFNIFNIDLNYIWRFAPGSDVILSYKNNAFSDDDVKKYSANLQNIFDKQGNHLISLKVLYFMDWNTLRP